MQVETETTGNPWAAGSLLLAAVLVSIAAAYWVQPLVSGNTNATIAVITIFAILAGFLIAVVTVIIEPAIRQATGWQDLQYRRTEIRRRIRRQKWLFQLYLATLVLALATLITPATSSCILLWLERLFTGLTTFVLLASFRLPGSLMQLQMARFDAELNEKMPKVLRDAMERKED